MELNLHELSVLSEISSSSDITNYCNLIRNSKSAVAKKFKI